MQGLCKNIVKKQKMVTINCNIKRKKATCGGYATGRFLGVGIIEGNQYPKMSSVVSMTMRPCFLRASRSRSLGSPRIP